MQDFLYNGFHLQGKTGKTFKKLHYVIFWYFRNFISQNQWKKNRKWDEKLIHDRLSILQHPNRSANLFFCFFLCCYPAVKKICLCSLFRFFKKATVLWQNILLDFKCKVQVFRKDHENLVKSSSWHFLQNIESRWNIYQIFAAFLKTWTLFSKQWNNMEVSQIFCSLLWKLKLDLVNVRSTGRFHQINMTFLENLNCTTLPRNNLNDIGSKHPTIWRNESTP